VSRKASRQNIANRDISERQRTNKVENYGRWVIGKDVTIALRHCATFF
jgi:hypothetical protein